jgi:hypothetical protein
LIFPDYAKGRNIVSEPPNTEEAQSDKELDSGHADGREEDFDRHCQEEETYPLMRMVYS